MLLKGCREGKGTPRLAEVKCPKCGAWVAVFVKMGGAIGETAMLTSNQKCTCGNILPTGSYESDYEQ